MFAVTYSRSSTPQQEDGTSLDTQGERTGAMAKQLGFEVPEEFALREIWTGADLERPMLDRLRRSVRENAVEAVFAYSPDRLSRDPLHLLMLVQEFQDHGVPLYFVDGKLEDTPEGRLVLYVQGYAGQKERSLIAERTMRGKREVAKSGRLPNGTGYGIFGYDYDKETKTRSINEAEANIVRMMFQSGSEGVPLHRIACRLNERKIGTKRGCRWHPLTVGRILRNRAYTGVQFYGENRYRKVKGNKREVTPRLESEVIRIEGFSPPIISTELFELVQERLSAPRAKRTKSDRQYVMTGFVNCLWCGFPVVGSCLNKTYRYYRCRATFATPRGPATCRARYIPADALEELVYKKVSEVLMDPRILVAELRRQFKTGDGDTGREVAKLRRDIRDLKSEQMRLVEQRQKDYIDQDLLALQIGPVKALCDEKVRALRVLEEQQQLKDDAADMEGRIIERCRKLSRKLENLSFEGKRSMFAAFGLKVEATREDVSITVIVGPEFTTTEQTLALPSVSKYSFRIVELKEVVVRIRSRLVEWVPCRS